MSDLQWCNLLEKYVQRYAGESTARQEYLRQRLWLWPERAFCYKQWITGNVAWPAKNWAGT